MVKRRQEVLSYQLRQPGHAEAHWAGVNSAALDLEGKRLFTAGKDGTIRSWDKDGKSGRCNLCLEGHSDWVTDIGFSKGGVLISASCDKSIRMWDPKEGSHLRCIDQHGDYVLSLATSSRSCFFASGGLGGEVYLWDAQALTGYPVSSSESEMKGMKLSHSQLENSVYSLAMWGDDAELVAAGTTGSVVKLWDTRAKGNEVSLSGHEATVRDICFSPDGTYLLSGGSDKAVKLFDLRQRECIATLSYHIGSLRALVCDPSFNLLFSGDLEGEVWVANMSSRRAALLCREEGAVHRLVVDPDDHSLWAATTCSSVRAWPTVDSVPEDAPNLDASPSGQPPIVRVNRGHHHGATSSDASSSAGLVPLVKEPKITLPGSVGAVSYRVLPNKRHILVKDSKEEKQLWDILRCSISESYSAAESMESIAERVCPSQLHSVPSWFSVDLRLGALRVHLEPSSCFSAEAYANEVGVDANAYEQGDEMRVNLGEIAIRSLFESWRQKIIEGDPDAAGPHANGPSTDVVEPTTIPGSVQLRSSSVLLYVWCRDTCASRMIPFSDLQGLENEKNVFPKWVVDLVLGQSPRPEEIPKRNFSVVPAEGSSLQPLRDSSLTASCIVKLRKVNDFIASKVRGPKGEALRGSRIELLCNGEALNLDMTLEAAFERAWRQRGEEMRLHYRLKSDE